MGAAICGCVALIAVLAAIHQQRRLEHRAATSQDQNALDLGLKLLIKDISRHRDAPVAARTVPVAPRPGPMIRPVARPPRGTPSDAVLVASRLRALPAEPVMPTASSSLPANLFDLFEDDDDNAPTTLASAYVESRSATAPVRVARRRAN